MSHFPNKIGMPNINTTKSDDISEAISNSLKEHFSSISTESSKIVLEKLQPLLIKNQTELNSLNENFTKLKKAYKLSTKEINTTLFKKKSKEVSEKVKKIKNRISEDNEYVQRSDENFEYLDRTTQVLDNFKTCINNLDSVFEVNSGKYRMNDVYEFSNKLSECTTFFMTKVNSLEMSVDSYLDNGVSQREKLKEKLIRTLKKLAEIRQFVNQNKNLNFNHNFLMEKNQLNYVNSTPLETISHDNMGMEITNPTTIESEYIHFNKFCPEDFDF